MLVQLGGNSADSASWTRADRAAALALTSAHHATPKMIDNQDQGGARMACISSSATTPLFQRPMVVASADTECAQADPVTG